MREDGATFSLPALADKLIPAITGLPVSLFGEQLTWCQQAQTHVYLFLEYIRTNVC